jgi:hypothetical protein
LWLWVFVGVAGGTTVNHPVIPVKGSRPQKPPLEMVFEFFLHQIFRRKNNIADLH